MEKTKRGRPAKYPWYTMNIGDQFIVPKKMTTIPPKAFEDQKQYLLCSIRTGILITRIA